MSPSQAASSAFTPRSTADSDDAEGDDVTSDGAEDNDRTEDNDGTEVDAEDDDTAAIVIVSAKRVSREREYREQVYLP